MKKKIKLIFLGRGKIASDCFDILNKKFYKKQFQLKAIVSDQIFFDNKKNISKNTFKIINNKPKNNTILKIIKKTKVNILISVLHPWILNDKILKLLNYNCYNLHNGDLPKYKGWNTTSHTLINNEKKISTLIHQMVKNIDEGPIVSQKKIKIYNNDTAEKLYKKIVKSASINFNNFLSLYLKKKLKFKYIFKKKSFYKKKDLEYLKKLKVKIKQSEYKIILGSYMPPYEPAYTKYRNKKIYLLPEESFKNLVSNQKKIN